MEDFKIHYFGCSFTALEKSNSGHKFVNFRQIIDKELSIESINLSKPGKSNQHIFDDVYNESKKLIDVKTENKKNHLFIIQTTFNDRLGLQCDILDSFVSLCKTEGGDNHIDKILINFYNDWLKYFYSRVNSLKEYKKQIELIAAYLQNHGIKFIFIGIDENLNFINDVKFFNNNNFIKFDTTYSLYEYIKINKLRITDIQDEDTMKKNGPDYHLNKEGHELLAFTLLEIIKSTQPKFL